MFVFEERGKPEYPEKMPSCYRWQRFWAYFLSDSFGKRMDLIRTLMKIMIWIIWKKIIAVIDATFNLQLRKESLKNNQACTGLEPLTSAILVQRSTCWAYKPSGSRSLNWFVINSWKDGDDVMKIWKSYIRSAGWRITYNVWKKIIASYNSHYHSKQIFLPFHWPTDHHVTCK